MDMFFFTFLPVKGKWSKREKGCKTKSEIEK